MQKVLQLSDLQGEKMEDDRRRRKESGKREKERGRRCIDSTSVAAHV